MLFEEFFKKKKISLNALQQGEPALFSEFKEHYEQMGEKSFDHTKKYWFNKLRRLYPLPPEVKAEKLRMENQVAEQTVLDTLTEPTPRDAAPKLGFKPKFKAGTTAPANKPTTETQTKVTPVAQVPSVEDKATSPEANEVPPAPAPKLGFKPKFKAAAKPAEEQTAPEAPAVQPDTEAEPQISTEAPKPAYKPRFQAKNITPKSAEPLAAPVEDEAAANREELPPTIPQAETTGSDSETTTENINTPTPKPGFKPRFKASSPPKMVDETQAEATVTPTAAERPETSVEQSDTPLAPEPEIPAAKPAYKPRFNPKMVKPKPPEDSVEE